MCILKLGNHAVQVLFGAGPEICRAVHELVGAKRLPPRIQQRAQTIHLQQGVLHTLVFNHLQQYFPRVLRSKVSSVTWVDSVGMPSGEGGKTVAFGTRIGWDSSLSIAITSVMMSIAWLTWVSPAPCMRIVASETLSRRLHTSLVTVRLCDVSFRAFWGCCRKYSLIDFFKAKRRSIILN